MSSDGPRLHVPPYNLNQATFSVTTALEKSRLIENAIEQIFNQNTSHLSFQVLYTAGYQIVLFRHGDILYSIVEQAIKKQVVDHRTMILEVDNSCFLEELYKLWVSHKNAIEMIRDILLYMDKHYVARHKKLTIYKLGVKAFGDNLLRNRQVAGRLVSLVLEIIQQERNGEQPPSRLLLKDITQMMCEVGKLEVYEHHLEQNFLRASREYYTLEANTFFSSSSTPEYIKRVFRRLAEERNRVERCLAHSTLPKIEGVIKECMLKQFAEPILEKENSGCLSMLRDWRVADLKLLYEAFKLNEDIEPFVDRVKNFLLDTGYKFVQEPEHNENPCQLVDGMLSLRERYDRLLDETCSSNSKCKYDRTFKKQIREAFVMITNRNPRFAEYLAMYVDAKLRKKGTVDEEYDTCFDKVIVLFRYLRDKDMFEKHYKTMLAKRLLSSRSASEEGERAILAKLKAENGHQFTNKIEGMFKDMEISEGNMERFRQRWQDRLEVDLVVQVLTTGFWPLVKQFDTELPPEVDHSRQVYEQFYLGNHSGRRLTWCLNMGNADLRFNAPSGKKYEINVHTLQMLILVLFNKADSIPMQDIMEKTKIPLQELKKQILSLQIQNRTHHGILKGTGLARDLDAHSTLSINPSFTSKHIKFKVVPMVVKETDEQAKETMSKINEDRKWHIDAVITRLMKSRKCMEHRNLTAEVIEHLKSRFAPTPDDIKKRIESLIDREYIERDPESRTKYVYIA